MVDDAVKDTVRRFIISRCSIAFMKEMITLLARMGDTIPPTEWAGVIIDTMIHTLESGEPIIGKPLVAMLGKAVAKNLAAREDREKGEKAQAVVDEAVRWWDRDKGAV
jgi:hypothetical protein